MSPTKKQSRIVRDYIRAIFDSTPMLRSVMAGETREGFNLTNGVRIEILVSDWRTVRGFTLLSAIVDEACFLGVEEESKISDTELVRALKPALATTGGKLVAISSPYAMWGWCYNTWKRDYGNDRGKTLVWNCSSRTMNPTLDQDLVDQALQQDPAAARAEYLGEWREDVATFIPRDVVERLVIPGRKELLPRRDRRYVAFADVSGGRGDDATLAIAHRDGTRVVVDCLKRYRPPFSPQEVIRRMVEVVRQYGIRRVTGDNYAAEFVSRAFESSGIRYRKAEKNKSALYLELLPRLCSGDIELLDDDALVTQLASLERKTRSGGRDTIDHPPRGHDDLANAVAGAAEVAFAKRTIVGAF